MPRPERRLKRPHEYPREFVEFEKRIRAFILEYLKNGRNATQAAISVGYKGKTHALQGMRMLQRPEVQETIRAHDEEQCAIAGLTVNRTLREVARIAYVDPARMYNDDGTLKSIHEMEPDLRAAIAVIEVEQRSTKSGQRITTKKIKLQSKNDALEKAMRYLGLFGKDNEQKHDVFQTLIVDANRTLDGKFSRLLPGPAKEIEG